MKVILMQEVKKLGKIGEIYDVKNGYARNYLIPNNLACIANDASVHKLKHQQLINNQKKLRGIKDAQKVAEKIEKISCTIPVKTGESGKMFGQVTSSRIAEALAVEGFNLDKKHIELSEPIKEIGVYTISVKIASEVTAKLKVWVVKE